MFDPIDPKQSLPDLEKGILQYWREEDVFKRSIAQRRRNHGVDFSFYDGPPFATGLPHYGHLIGGTIKDVIPRYQTMRGRVVERRFGWDCHGLPVENIIEKEHDIRDKRAIDEDIGIDRFNALCRESVQRFVTEWRLTVERMGRWVDMDYDYRTMDPDYMESIWWVFGELYKKNLIYEGYKPMHICPRCVTPLSNFEVTLGYKDVTDQSVIVKFRMSNVEHRMSNGQEVYALAWTTTPWTLPGNLFLAVEKKIEYVIFKKKDHSDLYIASKQFVENSKHSTFDILHALNGKDLIGKRYEHLFPYFQKEYKDNAFRIVEGDFVSTDEGTGIVHIAPGFGEDDYRILQKENAKMSDISCQLSILQHVTMDGKFTNEVTDFKGMNAKETDPKIAEWLKKNGKLFSKEPITHSYPHCWRCDSPLLNFATGSWFVAVEKIKNDLLLMNKETSWIPQNIRDGRFGKWLENAKDWAISRNRYWGTPLPIWRKKLSSGSSQKSSLFRSSPRLQSSNIDMKSSDIEVLSSRDDLMSRNLIRFTKITAVRHGESEGNLIPIFQGQVPGTNLTEHGKQQAQKTGFWLRQSHLPPSVIYHSPLARTTQTATLIAEQCGAPLIADDRLREVYFGEYEGKTLNFSDLTFVKERRAHKWDTQRPESIYHFNGMEKWENVLQRVSDFLNEILPRHRSEHIIIVTHADPVLNIRNFFTHIDPFKLSHQPYPDFAQPFTFFWDHDREASMDLHKDNADTVSWMGSQSKDSVEMTLVRHGETDWNKDDKTQGGNNDIPLNTTGEKQIAALASKLKKGYDCIISSDLSRAVQTANILSRHLNIPILGQWEDLRERDEGEWSGKTMDEILTKVPNSTLDARTVSFHHQTPPGGESLSVFIKRAQSCCERLLDEYPEKHVLVVCHGGMIRAIAAIVHNLSYKDAVRLKSKNAGTLAITLNPFFKRIPEILDCWFESGAMPYAQAHYPFELDMNATKSNPPGFPADFIAEGIDQTRGWFYTLIVLSTALFNRPAFKNCIVNGIVLAKDGQKMSKRLKNYPEPLKMIDTYGADALRFTLMRSPAVHGETLCFSASAVEQTMRGVLIPLWNAYGFFVTYANACRFEPKEKRRASGHPLDKWIATEMQNLVNRMTEELDRYDLSSTCAQLFETIDAITNWYIRLSRRRFAGKEGTEKDRENALYTLYDTLLTLSQLLAPICPFMTEAIYLNLVGEEHSSIHFTDWPAIQKLSTNDHALIKKQHALRLIVSLGNSIRSAQKIKVRQPLAKAVIATSYIFTDQDRVLLAQELNVKDVEFLSDPKDLAAVIIEVDARAIGPRLGKQTQNIIDAGKRGEFEQKDNGEILVLDETLSPTEFRISYISKDASPMRSIAADRGIVIALDTTLSQELAHEGMARDLVRSVQRLRKDAGLHMNDHIILSITGCDDNIVNISGDMIQRETNATFGKTDQNKNSVELNKKFVTICFEKR